MKEFKLKDIMSLRAIEHKIWTIFDVLRSESIASEEYHAVLFLLSLFKDGIISKDTLSNQGNIHEALLISIHNSNEKTTHQYLPIYESFKSPIKRISPKGLLTIIQVVSNVDHKVLSANFLDIFDSVLYRITELQGRYGGEFIQPIELTLFICALADLPKESKVFNPFAGLASFGVFLDQGQDYLGQEINRKTWALGALRIMAYERLGASQYLCDDTILNWPDQSEKFDLILANPPYGLRLSQKYKQVEPGIRTVEQFLIEKGVNSLNAKGKLIALLPQGFLFREMHEQRLRQHLIEEDLIDTIISLTGGLLLNTGIPLIVLVIRRDKKQQGKVCFIDAKKLLEAKNSREKVLNDYVLNSIVLGSMQDSDVVRVIDNSKIREFDYNLNVSRYFQKHIEGIKLKEIV
jgi:type I restriction enzyme M protein